MTVSVSAAYQAEHNLLQRQPAYTVSFSGIDQTYCTHFLVNEESDLDDSVDIDFALDIDKSYDLDTGLEQFLHDLFEGDAFATVFPYMQLPTGVAAHVIPDKGQSSIGSVVFVIEDVDGVATSLIAQGIGGRTVTFRAGFADILASDFAVFFTGVVIGYKTTADLAGYEIMCQDPQSLANKQVFNCSASKLTALLTGISTDTWTHYVILATDSRTYVFTTALNQAAEAAALDTSLGAGNWSFAQASVASVGSTITVADTTGFLAAGYVQLESEIIQYTAKTATTFTGLTRGALGTTSAAHAIGVPAKELLRIGPAHPCDIIQSVLTNTDKTGCSISTSLVNAAAFTAVKASMGAYTMEFRITGPAVAKTFLEDELYAVIACYPVMTGGGLFSINQFVEPTSAASVATIDHDSIMMDSSGKPQIGWDGNFVKMVNDVTYNYDWNPVTQLFESSYRDTRASSIGTYSAVPLVVNSQGLRSTLSGTAAFIAARVTLILNRYSNTAPVVTVKTFLQKNLIEPGDIVSLTSSLLPNRYTATRGVTASLFEVIDRSMVFNRGYVDFTLLWTGFSLLNKDDFDRADTPAGATHLTGNWGSAWSDLDVFKIVSQQLYVGQGSAFNDGHGYILSALSSSGDGLYANPISEVKFISGSNGLSGPMIDFGSTGSLALDCFAALYDATANKIYLRMYLGQVNPVTSDGVLLGSYNVVLVSGDTWRIHISVNHISVEVNSVVVIGPVLIDSLAEAASFAVGVLSVRTLGSMVVDNWRGGSDGWA